MIQHTKKLNQHIHFICIFEIISDNVISFQLVRIYKNNEKLIIHNQKRRITKLLGHVKMILDREKYLSLCAKNHHIHNEIYCKCCEKHIENNITSEKFCNHEGFVSVHNTQSGRCIVMIDLESNVSDS